VCAVVANANRVKGEPFTRDDFLPHVRGDEPGQPVDRASQVRAGGGVVMGLPALVSMNGTPAE
jgi:hypothetical protein